AAGGVDGVGFYSVQANGVSNTTPPGRSGVRFLTNDLVWYIGEKACTTCFGGQPAPTGVTYIYSIAGTSEITSRLATVNDAWPQVPAPALQPPSHLSARFVLAWLLLAVRHKLHERAVAERRLAHALGPRGPRTTIGASRLRSSDDSPAFASFICV